MRIWFRRFLIDEVVSLQTGGEKEREDSLCDYLHDGERDRGGAIYDSGCRPAQYVV